MAVEKTQPKKHRKYITVILVLILAFSLITINANFDLGLTSDTETNKLANQISSKQNNTDLSETSNTTQQTVKFAQITDIHISIDKPNSIKKFEQTIENTNSQNLDFIIITGDLVDWSEKPNWEKYEKTREKLNTPTFNTVGNHDYRETIFNVIWPAFPLPWWKPDNKALSYYNKHLTPNDKLTENYNIIFGPRIGDYSFGYKSIHMVILNSGYDVMKEGFGAQGSGLTDPQINWLEQDLENEENIFIALHHPIFYNENLKTSSCVTTNRNEFLNLVENHDVIAIIAGHTHETKSFTHKEIAHIQTDNPPAFRTITFDNNGMQTQIIGQPLEAKNETIHMLSQVWAGIQWTHIRILKSVKTQINNPLKLLAFALIITSGIGIVYKFTILKKLATR